MKYKLKITKTIIYEFDKEASNYDEAARIGDAIIHSHKGADHLGENILYKLEVILDEPALEHSDTIKGTTIPSWMLRTPEQTKEVAPEGVTVQVAQSNLEKTIVARTHTTKLTDKQREQLARDVIVYPISASGEPPVTYDSPIVLYDKEPLFKEYADAKIKAMASYTAPNSKIVAMLCNYEHIHGWLNFRSSKKDMEFLDRQAQKVIENIKPIDPKAGFVPGRE